MLIYKSVIRVLSNNLLSRKKFLLSRQCNYPSQVTFISRIQNYEINLFRHRILRFFDLMIYFQIIRLKDTVYHYISKWERAFEIRGKSCGYTSPCSKCHQRIVRSSLTDNTWKRLRRPGYKRDKRDETQFWRWTSPNTMTCSSSSFW